MTGPHAAVVAASIAADNPQADRIADQVGGDLPAQDSVPIPRRR